MVGMVSSRVAPHIWRLVCSDSFLTASDEEFVSIMKALGKFIAQFVIEDV